MRIFVFTFFIVLSFLVKANDSLQGSWRGTIIGHTDNKDYFLNASITLREKENYTIRLAIFSEDYRGEFLLQTKLKEGNKLYIDNFESLNEFPYTLPHIRECFTGFFLIKKEQSEICELDLYRDPINRRLKDFIHKDSMGNYIPDFECFTSVLLRFSDEDTLYAERQNVADSIVQYKKTRAQELSSRKLIATKEWTVRNENITLQVWDNNKQDGDIISLKFNDTWVLSHFLLKKDKYTIHLKLKEKDNRLLLFAENLGSIPPNTAAVSIDDNEYIRTFILNSDLTKSETVKIILMK